MPIQGWSDITVHEMATVTIRDTSDLSLATTTKANTAVRQEQTDRGYLLANYVPVHYVIVKALPRVCMKNTARGGVSRG